MSDDSHEHFEVTFYSFNSDIMPQTLTERNAPYIEITRSLNGKPATFFGIFPNIDEDYARPIMQCKYFVFKMGFLRTTMYGLERPHMVIPFHILKSGISYINGVSKIQIEGIDLWSYMASTILLTETLHINNLRSFLEDMSARVEKIMSDYFLLEMHFLANESLDKIAVDLEYPVVNKSIYDIIVENCERFDVEFTTTGHLNMPVASYRIINTHGDREFEVQVSRETGENTLIFLFADQLGDMEIYEWGIPSVGNIPLGTVMNFHHRDGEYFKVIATKTIYTPMGLSDTGYERSEHYMLAWCDVHGFTPVAATRYPEATYCMDNEAHEKLHDFFLKIGEVNQADLTTDGYRHANVSYQKEQVESEKPTKMKNTTMAKDLYKFDEEREFELQGVRGLDLVKSTPWCGHEFGEFFPEEDGRHVVFSPDPSRPWKDVVGPMIIPLNKSIPKKNPMDYLLFMPDGSIIYYEQNDTKPKWLIKTKGEIFLDCSGAQNPGEVPSFGGDIVKHISIEEDKIEVAFSDSVIVVDDTKVQIQKEPNSTFSIEGSKIEMEVTGTKATLTSTEFDVV